MTKQFEPLDFINACTKCFTRRDDRGEHVGVERLSQIAEAILIGVVAIDENGYISESAVVKPDTECWFHFDCTGNAGATFNIIVDSECKRWLPVSRRSGKVTRNIKPKRSVNLESLSRTDQSLLLDAITKYIDVLWLPRQI